MATTCIVTGIGASVLTALVVKVRVPLQVVPAFCPVGSALSTAPEAVFAAVSQLPQVDVVAVTPVTVRVPKPLLAIVTGIAETRVCGGAPAARVIFTGEGACAIGCVVTFMVTGMALLSPAKVDWL